MVTLRKKFAAGLLGAALLVSMSSCSLFGSFASPGDSGPPDTPPTSPSETTPVDTEAVSLCVPNDNADGFNTYVAQFAGPPDELAYHLIELLVEAGALPAGVEMLSIHVEDEITVDMNAAYGQAVNSTGTAGEYMLIGTVVNTLLTFFDMHFVYITVEGEPLTTGHSDDPGAPLDFFIDQRTHYDGPLELGDLPDTIANLPDSAALENLYRYIGGYWNSSKGEFIGFITRCGKPHVELGLWDSEYMRWGAMTSVAPAGELTAELIYLLEEQPAWEGDDGFPQEPATILVDLAGFPNNGKIKVSTGWLNNGKTTTYTYAGMSFQEAYDAAH